YPALAADREQGCIVVEFEQNEQQAKRINEDALFYLFSLQFREQYKQLKRLVSTSFSGPSTLFLGALQKTKPELTALLLLQLVKQIYGDYNQNIPGSSEFASRVAQVKKEGFYRRGQESWQQFMAALRRRRQVAEQLAAFVGKSRAKGHFQKEGYSRLERELQQIFPTEILYQNPDYQEVSRRLDYLYIRLERFYANPLKDEQKEKQVAPFTSRLQAVADDQQLSFEAQEALQQYKEMLVEFKISVFAPEIRRRFAISPKKLETQWQQALKYLPFRS
ncbi:hypothetical protein CSB45_14680, partial [candidate division KSB3 bacterium]